MRLCIIATGAAINATAAAQQMNAEIRPAIRANEDWLAVLMNWGGVKRETANDFAEELCNVRGNVVTWV